MMLVVVATAEPADPQRVVIAVVMGIDAGGAANLARLGDQITRQLGCLNGKVSAIAPGMILTPALLTGDRLAQSASPTKPVSPSSVRACRT